MPQVVNPYASTLDLPSTESGIRTSPTPPLAHAAGKQLPVTESRGIDEEPTPPFLRRSPTTSLSQPLQQHNPQLRSPGLKSPGYLQGKNPYGRILDRIEHPYRESKPLARGPPSQLGSSIDGRPRTSATFKFKTRRSPSHEPEQEITDRAPQSAEPRQLQRTVSVKDVKNFFESKASELRSEPLLPLSRPDAVAKRITSNCKIDGPQLSTISQRQSESEASRALMPNSAGGHFPPHEGSGEYLPISNPSPAPKREMLPQHGESSAKSNSTAVEPQGVVRSVRTSDTANGQIPLRQRQSLRRLTKVEERTQSKPLQHEETPKTRPGSTNTFTESQRSFRLLRNRYNDFSERQKGDSFTKNKSAAAASEASKPSSVSDEHVRSSSSQQLDGNQQRPRRSERSSTDHNLRQRAPEHYNCEVNSNGPDQARSNDKQRHSLQAKQCSTSNVLKRPPGSRQTRPGLSEQQTKNIRESLQQTRQRSLRPSKWRMVGAVNTNVHNNNEETEPSKKLDDFNRQSLGHDGPSSDHRTLRQASAPAIVSASNTGVEEDYCSFEVPHHVDYRSAYGRRHTKDFGFPGARIKPRLVSLQDPSNWDKRACGHFSSLSKNDTEASVEICKQCEERMPAPVPAKRTVTNTSTSSSSESGEQGRKPSKRRHFQSDKIQTDQCGVTFAQDLGDVIDTIIQEHAGTLRSVIDNINSSQSNLNQIRRISEDLLQRCKIEDTYNELDEPEMPGVGRQLPYPYIPPRAVEKLNVGAPGHMGPTVNDSQATLRKSIRSAPELIKLVQSAADNFGIDLDQGPTAEDDMTFEQAPVEESLPAMVLSRRGSTFAQEEKRSHDDRQSMRMHGFSRHANN